MVFRLSGEGISVSIDPRYRSDLCNEFRVPLGLDDGLIKGVASDKSYSDYNVD